MARPSRPVKVLLAQPRKALGRIHGLAVRFETLPATVLTPEHGDFNDDLAALGPQALAARLGLLLGLGAWAAPATPRARTGARQVP